MKLRSTIFLTLSLIVHAVCVAALALSHFKGIESPGGSSVEVTMGETLTAEDPGQLVARNDVQPVAQPEIKPIEKVEEKTAEVIKPLPKKAAPKPKKIVKAPTPKPPTVLPPKEQPAQAEPEQLSPELSDSDAVAISEQPEEEAPQFIPVKDQAAAQPLDEAEDKIEATSQDTLPPAAVPTAEQPAQPGLGQGGDTKGDAVPTASLAQFSGNKAPEYPIRARKEQRQGEVNLLYRVTRDGRVTEVQIAKSSGHPDLDESAVKAISKFRFVPGQEGWAKHSVIFTLKGSAAALPSKLRTQHAAKE